MSDRPKPALFEGHLYDVRVSRKRYREFLNWTHKGFTLQPEIQRWMDHHVGTLSYFDVGDRADWVIYENEDQLVFRFREEHQALLFKLTWV